GMYPHFALAAFYQVVIGFILRFNQRKGFAQVYHILVTFFPIVKHGKLFYYLLLYGFYTHVFCFVQSYKYLIAIRSLLTKLKHLSRLLTLLVDCRGQKLLWYRSHHLG